MRKITFFVTLLLLLAGCRQQAAVSPRLVELDSLIAVSPDSAAALLQDYPADSLRDPENRAYHALLATQAKYKAYIPVYSLDTINLAASQYADGHDLEKQTRSILYKGCVFEELTQIDSAMYCYKFAEDLAIQIGNKYYHGYALMRQAWLYHDQFDFERAISLYRLALDSFETPKDDKLTLQVLNAIASLYITIDIDSAKIYGERAMQLCLSSDRQEFDYCSKILADIYFVKHDYRPCIELAEEAIANTQDRQVYFHCHQLLAQAFAYIGAADSSSYYLMMSTPPADKQDSVMFLTTQSVIAASSHDDQVAQELHLFVGNMADTIVTNRSIQQLDQATHDYESSKMVSHHKKKQKKVLWFVFALAGLLLLSFAANIFTRRKKQAELYRKEVEITKQKQTNQSLDNKNKDLLLQMEEMSSELDRRQQEITEHRRTNEELINANVDLASANQILNEVNKELSRQMEDKQILLQKADEELKQLRETIASIGQSPIANSTVEFGPATIARIGTLVDEIKKQAIVHTKAIKSSTKSSLQVMSMMHDYFDREYCLRLQMLVDALYPKFLSNIGKAVTPLTEEEIVVACMHFLSFPNKVIGAYLGYTSRFTISHKKKSIAEKVMGRKAAIIQIVQ